MTRYRIRIYTSPDQKLIYIKSFKARDIAEATVIAGKMAGYIRYRKRISAYRMSYAVDVLRIDPMRWVTVITA